MQLKDCSWHPSIYDTNVFDPRCKNGHPTPIACPSAKPGPGGGDAECVATVGACVGRAWSGDNEAWRTGGLDEVPVVLGKVLSVSSNAKGSAKVLDGDVHSFWEGSGCVADKTVRLGLERAGKRLSFTAPLEGDCVEHVEVAVAPVHDRPAVVGVIRMQVYEHHPARKAMVDTIAATVVQSRAQRDGAWTTHAVFEPGIALTTDVEVQPPAPVYSVRVVYIVKTNKVSSARACLFGIQV